MFMYLAIMVSHDTLFCDISFNSSVALDFGLFALRSIYCLVLLCSACQTVTPAL